MEKITVMLSTYNGAKYLEKQIDSILAQKDVYVSLYIRDDGSTDGTVQILKEYEKKGLLNYYIGENVGPALSFIDLLFHVPNTAQYYSFADQDDYWDSDKLKIAIDSIKDHKEKPVMYDSAVNVVDIHLNKTGIVYGSKIQYNFLTQISRSNVIGCTIVINKKLFNYLIKYRPTNITMHDQWIAIVCKALEGYEMKDVKPRMLYRQHQANVIGYKNIFARFKYSSLSDINSNNRLKQAEELYNGYRKYMTLSKKEQLNNILNYKNNFICKLRCVLGNYNTESFIYNLLIRIAFLRGKF